MENACKLNYILNFLLLEDLHSSILDNISRKEKFYHPISL